MVTEVIRIAGVAILCLVALTVLRPVKGEYAFAVRIAGVLLVGAGLLSRMIPFFGESEHLFSVGLGAEYAKSLLRALGLALLTQFCSSVCRDCGENGLAQGVELAGKLEILFLCLPLLSTVVEYASQLASLGG